MYIPSLICSHKRFKSTMVHIIQVMKYDLIQRVDKLLVRDMLIPFLNAEMAQWVRC